MPWNDAPDYTPAPPPKWFWALLVGIGVSIVGCSVAVADPCEAELPSQPGTVFTGQVYYVGDGDSICVGPTDDPNTWIEVRTVDFNAPELNTTEGHTAKAVMVDLALGEQAACVVTPGRSGSTISYDRVLASCSIDGASLAALMRESGVIEGGN